MSKEHDFQGGDAGQWERVVFEEAVKSGYFTTYNAVDKQRIVHPEFVSALRYAHVNERSIIYAVARSGRHTVIPRNAWNEYAKLFLEIRRPEL